MSIILTLTPFYLILRSFLSMLFLLFIQIKCFINGKILESDVLWNLLWQSKGLAFFPQHIPLTPHIPNPPTQLLRQTIFKFLDTGAVK